MIDPTKDGIEHINAYSKAVTWLGKNLSNFTYSPFTHPVHGAFSSMEGYWYWLLTGDDRLKGMYGKDAKALGVGLLEDTQVNYNESFREAIKEGLSLKINARLDLVQELALSSLPIVHYYTRKKDNGEKYAITTSRHLWVWHEVECIRAKLQGEQAPPALESP